MLLEIVERRSPETNRKSIVYRLQCDACGALIEGSKGRYERGKYHCCNNNCVSVHRRAHPELYPDNSRFRNTPEACAKAEATRQRKIAEGTYVRSWKGRKHSEETKRHLSEVSSNGIRAGVKNGMYGRRQSKEARARMSDAKTKLILEGKFKAYGTANKKGHYTSTKTNRTHFFRSSWEEAVMQHLDLNDVVLSWDYECIRIPYYYNDNKRWYVPDFVIMFLDDSHEMWEVKPKEFLQAERVKCTTAAGESFCHENGFRQYKLVTRQVLRELGIVVK